MTDKRFEVTFNDSDFHLKDNETGEELKLVDERVCYDYIADRWNALHETNERLREYNNKLMKQPLLFDVQTIPNTIEIMEANTQLEKENEQLKERIKDWHQRTFKAHEYFNILEKVIDEVCNDDISNQIWKEYEKKERLIE